LRPVTGANAYSITSSARVNTVGEMPSPSDLVRLIVEFVDFRIGALAAGLDARTVGRGEGVAAAPAG
jgi:hypothetical protein